MNKIFFIGQHEKFEISRNKTWIENIPARNFKNDWKEPLNIKKRPNGLEPTKLWGTKHDKNAIFLIDSLQRSQRFCSVTVTVPSPFRPRPVTIPSPSRRSKSSNVLKRS